MPRPVRLSDIPDSLSPDDFWELLGELEHEQLDFKQGAADLSTLIPAMAMTDGGLAVLGVRDDRTIVGCGLSQRVLDKVTEAGRLCGVEVQLKETRIGRFDITIVAVPEVRGRIVTTPDGRLVRRVGSSNQPLLGDALARFVREREERPAEEIGLPLYDLADFDLKRLNAALARDGKPGVRRDGVLRALIDLGLALPADPPSGPSALRAAAILFAHDPRKYVPAASVQVVRRVGVGPGPGPAHAREELSGPVESLLDGVLQFVDSHTQRYQVVIGTRREVMPEYPTPVLREAVLNALAHRDYGLAGATVDVTIWDDRIEVQSPGPLPGHITLDNMRDEHYSRNRRMMRVLKLIGLVEEYGEGVDRMIREMEARLMEPPLFTATPSSVTVTLRNRFLVAVEDQAWLALLGSAQLTPQERRLMVIARREDGVTPRRLRTVLPDVDVEAVLRGAAAKGLLIRTGQAGGARYVLSDEIVMRAGSKGLEARSRTRQKILDEIRARGSLSTAEAAELLQEDLAVVRHLMNDLVRSGLAEARGRTRGRRYHAV